MHDEVVPRVLGVPVQDHQRLRVGHRQRAQQDRVHEAVDGGVGSDAEREGQDGEDTESLAARHRAQRVAQVGSEGVEPGDDPDFPGELAGPHGVAELPLRAHGGGFVSEALAAFLGLEHLAVEVHFLRQLFLEAVAAEEETQLVEEPGPHGQAHSMTAAIAPVMRSKPCASRARCFRPAGVMR